MLKKLQVRLERGSGKSLLDHSVTAFPKRRMAYGNSRPATVANAGNRGHQRLRSQPGPQFQGTPLGEAELRQIDAYWQTSLYLCLGMLYLWDNPLLKEPLALEHIKPRACWATGVRTPPSASPIFT